MHKGDVMRLVVPGSGGMYPATERERAALMRDIENGIVTIESAHKDYALPRNAAPVK
jgi:N-methylhydantoinase B/oxoprolinase/acetone carboxylase alpha subunit